MSAMMVPPKVRTQCARCNHSKKEHRGRGCRAWMGGGYYGDDDSECGCSAFDDGVVPTTRRAILAKLVHAHREAAYWRTCFEAPPRKCMDYVRRERLGGGVTSGLCAPCARPANHAGACIPDLNAARRWPRFHHNEYQAFYLLAPTSPSILPWGTSSSRATVWRKADRRVHRAHDKLVKRLMKDPRAWRRFVEGREPAYAEGARLREAVRDRWTRKPWTNRGGAWG